MRRQMRRLVLHAKNGQCDVQHTGNKPERATSNKVTGRVDTLTKKRNVLLTVVTVPFSAIMLLGTTPLVASADTNVTTVTFWEDWTGAGQKQMEAMVDRFNKTHPTIHVVDEVQSNMTTKFLTGATSGQVPDIMEWDRWQTALYAPKGVLYPINDFVKQDNVNLNNFYSAALNELTWNNHLYGLPLTVDARALFYNKRLFKQAGIKNPPKTWAQLEADAKKLTVWKNGKLVQAGFLGPAAGDFNMWLQMAGGSMLTPDGKKTNFNSAAGLTTLNFWSKLLFKDKVWQVGFDSGLPNGEDAFGVGQAAMETNGPWMLGTYEQYGNKLDFGVVQPPKGPGPHGRRASMMGGFGLVIPAAAKNKEAAWEFEKWWIADEHNDAYWGEESSNLPGNIQAGKIAYFSKNPLIKPFLQTLKYAKTRPTVTGYFPLEGNVTIPIFTLFEEGKMTAKQALDKAQQQGDQVLAQNPQQ